MSNHAWCHSQTAEQVVTHSPGLTFPGWHPPVWLAGRSAAAVASGVRSAWQLPAVYAGVAGCGLISPGRLVQRGGGMNGSCGGLAVEPTLQGMGQVKLVERERAMLWFCFGCTACNVLLAAAMLWVMSWSSNRIGCSLLCSRVLQQCVDDVGWV